MTCYLDNGKLFYIWQDQIGNEVFIKVCQKHKCLDLVAAICCNIF